MVRRRHTQPGMIGSAARRSTGPRPRPARRSRPSRASEGADSQGQAMPPWTSAVSRTPPQAKTASAPAQSIAAAAAGRRPRRLAQVADDQPQGDRADRQVDQEDPAPVRVRGEQSAERRARHGGDRPHRGQPGLDLRPFLQRVQVGGEGLDRALERAAAQALDDPEGDQRAHVPGRRAQQGAEQEEADPGDQDRLAAEGVGELAVDGEGDGDGEQVAGEEPGEDGEAAEVADDLRYGGGDDGAVQRGERHAEHQGGDDGTAPAGLAVCRAASRIAGRRRPRGCPLRRTGSVVHGQPSPAPICRRPPMPLTLHAAAGCSLVAPEVEANPETGSTRRVESP